MSDLQLEPQIIEDDLDIEIVDAPSTTHTELSEDPNVGIEDLRRQFKEAEEARKREADQRIEAQRQLEAERAARLAAERATQEARTSTTQYQQQELEARYQSIINGLGQAREAMDNLTREKTQLTEAGKFAEAAAVDAKMAKVGARLVQYEDAQTEHERYVQNLANTPPSPPPPPPQPSQAEQQQAFLNRLPQKSADWIRNHPQYFSDKGFRDKVNAAAQYIENIKGLNHNSDGYFEQLEIDVGLRQPAARPTAQSQPPQDSRRSAMPAAPPTRTAPGSNQTKSPTRIELSPEQREFARATMTPELCGKDKDGRPIPPELAYARMLAKQRARPDVDPENRWKTSSKSQW